jgi:hypothetical protein
MDELRGAFRVLYGPKHGDDKGGGTQFTDHFHPHPKWQSVTWVFSTRGASSRAEHGQHPPHHAGYEGDKEQAGDDD